MATATTAANSIALTHLHWRRCRVVIAGFVVAAVAEPGSDKNKANSGCRCCYGSAGNDDDDDNSKQRRNRLEAVNERAAGYESSVGERERRVTTAATQTTNQQATKRTAMNSNETRRDEKQLENGNGNGNAVAIGPDLAAIVSSLRLQLSARSCQSGCRDMRPQLAR